MEDNHARSDGIMTVRSHPSNEERIAVLEVHASDNKSRISELTTTVNNLSKQVAVLLEYMHNGPNSQRWPRGIRGQAIRWTPVAGVSGGVVGLVEIIRTLVN